MQHPSRTSLALALAPALGLGGAIALAVKRYRGSPAQRYVLHVYDHCPFCNRVEWLMQQHRLPYKRVVYGYGAGAKPEMAAQGHGYDASGDADPRRLTGQKMLPVLVGAGVPCEPGALGLPESMEICAFLIGQHKLVVPCESGRGDIKKFTSELAALKAELCEHRMVRMPIEDWADPRDTAYRRNKKKLPMPPPPVVAQPELLAQLNAKLAELPGLLRGGRCLNAWGWGMDDVVLLPLVRIFTCVKGAAFPPQVEAWLNIEATQMVDYRKHAL